MKQIILTLAAVAASVTAVSGQDTGAYGRYYIDGLIYERTSEATVSCDGAFDDGVKNVVIPETINAYGSVYTVTGISSGAFSYYRDLCSVTIPNSVTTIGASAFTGCGGLESVNISDLSAWCRIDFSDNVSNPLWFAGHLYLDGELITDLTIPDGITEIKAYAFTGCDGLASVTIGNSVTTIGDYAFFYCDGLASVTIGNSVTTIGSYAFHAEYSDLKRIDVLAPVPPSVASDDVFYHSCYSEAELNVPIGSLEAYRAADVWKEFKNIQEKDFGGVDGVKNDAVSVTAKGGSIEITSADNARVEVYNLSGQLVYSGTETTVGGLARGIYLVRIAGQTFKVAL
mgnify:CR=1 FL=1